MTPLNSKYGDDIMTDIGSHVAILRPAVSKDFKCSKTFAQINMINVIVNI